MLHFVLCRFMDHRPQCLPAAATLLPLLLQEKAFADAVDEQRRILRQHGNDLTMDVLSEMEVLHRNISEALRIHPPLLLVMRYVKQPFSVTTSQGKTYTVPAVSSSLSSLSINCSIHLECLHAGITCAVGVLVVMLVSE